MNKKNMEKKRMEKQYFKREEKKQKVFGRKSSSKKSANKFVTYSGFIPEVDMVLNDGYFFKTYLLLNEEKKRGFVLEQALHYPGVKIQLIATKEKAFGVFGIKAEITEDALEQFRRFEKEFSYPSLTCEEWFSVMAERLRFEPFCGMPQGKKAKKTAVIRFVQPYDVNVRQKDMEISGRTIKTLILMGYPSKLFPAFATELLEIADNITLVVFAEGIDTKQCLDGINLSQDIRAARKEVMKDFLRNAIKEGTNLYNTCALVMVDGLPGEVEETCKTLKLFCRKYLITASELDYQQAEAFRSTLPLMKNHIRYYRVLSENNLKALLPWSELKVCKRNVGYGEDRISGKIKYDRRIHQENGFILSSNYHWTHMQVKKETDIYKASPLNSIKKIFILAREGMDISVFMSNGSEKENRHVQLNYDKAPEWLIRAAIIRWAVNGLSTNGRIMKLHMEMILRAAKALTDEEIEKNVVDESDGNIEEKLSVEKIKEQAFMWEERKLGKEGKEPRKVGLKNNAKEHLVESFVERFLSGMGENERRALAIRPLIKVYDYMVTSTDFGEIYQVMGKGAQAELAYALLFHSLHGVIYSLNSELLAWNMAELFKLHEDSLYTFLTQDNRTLYESRVFAKYLKEAHFLFVGEHKIFEKLKLAALIGLDKKQREWISEPAKGALLMTRLVNYQLKRDEQVEEKEGKKQEEKQDGRALQNG